MTPAQSLTEAIRYANMAAIVGDPYPSILLREVERLQSALAIANHAARALAYAADEFAGGRITVEAMREQIAAVEWAACAKYVEKQSPEKQQ